jgi:hypothetical protein
LESLGKKTGEKRKKKKMAQKTGKKKKKERKRRWLKKLERKVKPGIFSCQSKPHERR